MQKLETIVSHKMNNNILKRYYLRYDFVCFLFILKLSVVRSKYSTYTYIEHIDEIKYVRRFGF